MLVMHPIRRQRLQIVTLIFLLSACAAGLVIYVLGQNANFFFTPSQILAGEYRSGSTIRVGGMVVEGSVSRPNENLQTQFTLTDGKTSLDIVYEGILPDLFAENEAAIATGVMSVSNKLIASQVLAKHDENYTPPELTETMDFIRYSDDKVQ